jgi:hypothetical protein
MRADMEALRGAAETAAEMSLAEKIARAEVIRRNERLGREVFRIPAPAKLVFSSLKQRKRRRGNYY